MLEDLVNFSTFEIHVSKLRLFKCDADILPAEVLAIRSMDNAEFIVDSIVDHRGNDMASYEFRVRWLGYEEEEDTWLGYNEVKALEALDRYEEMIGIKFGSKK